LAKVTKDIEEKSMAAIEVKERCEQARVLLETKREELEKVKEELDSKMEEYNEMRTKEASMKRKADDAERLVAESTRAVSHWSSALENLALHPINLDEIESVDRDEEQPKALPDNVEHADYEVEDMDVDDEEEGQEKDASQTRSADAGLPQLSPEELEDIDADALETQIEQGEAKLQRTRPNLSVLTEYVRRAREFKKRMGELDQITQQRDGAQKQMDDLRTRRLEEFMTGFNVISYKLKEMYQMITLGGNAELELVDSLDPFSEGLVFSVMPPKKSWKNISHLSGGEKTLSSLALVFALHQYKPTPLYVMDEIDAALDFRNVSIVANYIKERTRDAQFVIISLRNNMFELADRLVGIYKTDNRTKSIALDTEHTAGTLHSTTSPTEPAVSTPVK
ncbi:Structural maintenance of chromosomes protein 4, partial [Linderina macrospora]